MRSPTFLGSFLRAVRIRSICALSSGFWPDSAASSALAASNWGSSFRASWYSAFASGSFRSEGRTYPFNLRAFVGLLAGQRGELGSRRLELGIELQGLLVLRLRLRQLPEDRVGAGEVVVPGRQLGIRLDHRLQLLQSGRALALRQVGLAPDQASRHEVGIAREQVRHEGDRVVVAALSQVELSELGGERGLARRSLEG